MTKSHHGGVIKHEELGHGGRKVYMAQIEGIFLHCSRTETGNEVIFDLRRSRIAAWINA